MKVCEKYNVDKNKWSGLAPLNSAREWPGSILLKSLRAFCFCGSQGYAQRANSIESLETHKDREWRTLPLNDQMAKTYDLAATQYGNKIVLFGGDNHATFNTYIYSEEGELERDLSEDPLIPGRMCRGSHSV